MKAKIVFLLFLVNFVFLSYAQAGWVDDWVAQKTETSPGYFEGQKRGYVTGGGFSARVPNTTDYLFSSQMPSIKAGCGGVDVFMGGFSFLNADYVVQKFQRIMANAPAFAFDIALSELCQTCANGVKSLETLSNQLNAIQFDDCKSSKAVYTMASDIWNKKGQSEQNATASTQKSIDGGVNDNYLNSKENQAAAGGVPEVGTGATAQIAGCDPALQNVFMSGQSLVTSMLTLKGATGSDMDGLIRGYVGDVVPLISNEQFDFYYIPPCDDNKDFKDFVTGTAKIRPADGSACVTLPGGTMNDWIYTRLNSINTAMKTGSNLSAPDITFINTVPFPVYTNLKYGIVTKTDVATVHSLSDILTKVYAYVAFTDVLNQSKNMGATYKQGISKSADTASCNTQPFTSLVTYLDNMAEFAARYNADAANLYNNSLAEYNTSMEMVERSKAFERILKETLQN